MLTNTNVSLQYRFYPIGITPAVNLFRDRPSYVAGCEEQQKVVKVLSLACGDPRDLLFSLWCEGGENGKCAFEFTCCDLEPAILARNIVLFTLIIDKIPPECDPSIDSDSFGSIWNIFYHFYLSKTNRLTLQNHAEKLVQLSREPDRWLASPYGNLVRFLSHDTIEQLRRYWSLYAETKAFTSEQAKTFDRRARRAISSIYSERISEPNLIPHGVRSSGALRDGSLSMMTSALKGFWKTGVAGGNRDDILALGNGGKGFVSPMFAISSAPSGVFSVHHGSDPLAGFHLAEAFNNMEINAERVDPVVSLAKAQFRNWCASFARYAKNNTAMIAVFCGEAIRFCHELRFRHEGSPGLSKFTRTYVAPWTSRLLALDGVVEHSHLFDIIDTSNLVDYVGILNVLPAASPLLRREPSSVLYTESLLKATEEISSSLDKLLCSDVTTISLIIGLAPLGHLLGYTADAVGIESARPLVTQERRMRVPWRVPQLGDFQAVEAIPGTKLDDMTHRVGFDPEQLGEYFFKMYLKIFAYEDLSQGMSTMGRDSILRQFMAPLAVDLRYYSRLNIAVLLHLAKTHVVTDWPKFIRIFLKRVEADRSLPVASNSLQELYLHLYIFGLCRGTWLDSTPREQLMRPASGERGILARQRPPPVVFVTLVVPRKRLEVFTGRSPNLIGEPGLHISVSNNEEGLENCFFSIACFFGKVKAKGRDKTNCEIEEDNKGWMGSADMIVTCPVPAVTLLLGRRKGVRVCVRVNTCPSTFQFTLILGLRNVVFECGLDDETRLWVTEKPPGSQPSPNTQQLLAPPNADSEIAQINFNKTSQATGAKICTHIPKTSDESKALANGAQITVTPKSPCTLLLRVQGFPPHHLVFPLPIDGELSRTRIARKSSWLEVSVPFALALAYGGYGRNPFPVTLDNSQPFSWSFHHLRLEQQPRIPLNVESDWLQTFMGLTLGENEQAKEASNAKASQPNPLLSLSASFRTLFLICSGKNSDSGLIGTFRITGTDYNSDPDTLLFATALRHDRDAGSVLLDAYAVPLTHPQHDEMLLALEQHVTSTPLDLALDDESRVLWKQLLPSLAERCRCSWTHRASCEYLAQGCIPLSTDHAATPLCSCGEGQTLADFPDREECKPFAKYATRVAISPIFPVPYVELAPYVKPLRQEADERGQPQVRRM